MPLPTRVLPAHLSWPVRHPESAGPRRHSRGSTEAEDDLMGEESDALKSQAAKFAGEQIDKGTDVAEHAWQGAKEESAKQGLMPNIHEAMAGHRRSDRAGRALRAGRDRWGRSSHVGPLGRWRVRTS